MKVVVLYSSLLSSVKSTDIKGVELLSINSVAISIKEFLFTSPYVKVLKQIFSLLSATGFSVMQLWEITYEFVSLKVCNVQESSSILFILVIMFNKVV